MTQEKIVSSGIRVSQMLWALCGTLFMGLAWRSASRILGYPAIVSDILIAMGGIFLLALSVASLVQVVRNPDPLVSAFSEKDARGEALLLPGLCALLLAIGVQSWNEPLARLVWLLGLAWQVGCVGVFLMGQRLRFINEDGVDALQMLPGVSLMVAAMGGIQFGFPVLSWLLFSAGFLMILPLWLLALQQYWLNRSVLRGRAFLLAPLALVYVCLVGINAGDADIIGAICLFGALALALLFLAGGAYVFEEGDVAARWGMCMALSALAMALVLFDYKSGAMAARIFSDIAIAAASLSYGLGWHALLTKIPPRT